MSVVDLNRSWPCFQLRYLATTEAATWCMAMVRVSPRASLGRPFDQLLRLMVGSEAGRQVIHEKGMTANARLDGWPEATRAILVVFEVVMPCSLAPS